MTIMRISYKQRPGGQLCTAACSSAKPECSSIKSKQLHHKWRLNEYENSQGPCVCSSNLTSHEANRRLEPFGPLRLASPAVQGILVAELSGCIWQHITAAVRCAVPTELLPRGRNDGSHRARGVCARETSPQSSHLTT